MTGIKKILLTLSAIVLLALLIGLGYLQTKKTKSRTLAQYIPESQYVARVNTKEAIKLFLSLEKDSFKTRRVSKWSTLFRNPKITGIDMLVNPWFFKIGDQYNAVFSIKSIEKFNVWMNSNCDSSMGALELKDESIQFYHFKGRAISFYANTSGAGLLSIGGASKAVATSFFENKNTKTIPFAMQDELIQIKLKEELYFIDSLINLNDTSLKLYVNDKSIRINNIEEPKFKDAFVFSKSLNQISLRKLKKNKMLHAMLQYMGLKNLLLNKEAKLRFNLSDTIQRHIKTVSYDFNDDFEKVAVIKKRTTILPNMNLSFEFEDTAGAKEFFVLNNLRKYRSKMFRVRQHGTLVSIFSSGITDKTEGSSSDMLFLKRDKLDFVINKCQGLSFISSNKFKDLDYIYLQQGAGQSSGILQTKVHPVLFLFKIFSKNIP